MKPKVLYGVLNWGLGHATRSIPLINQFVEDNWDVYVASDGDALTFLQQELPALSFFELPGYNVRYPYKSIFLNIAKYLPDIITAIRGENKKTNELAGRIKPDLIVSDNRYGFRNKNVYSVIMSHQINLQLANAVLSKTGSFLNRKLISAFDELWIPDFEESILSGKLSKVNWNIKHVYTGPLSRLKKTGKEIIYDIAVVLSGPEPQRTYFEEMILKSFYTSDKKTMIVLGKMTEKKEWKLNENVTVKNYALSDELNSIMNQSEIIICRSGYSTIMDLAAIGKKAILIPTPGQSEQEYLGDLLKKQNIFYSVKQEKFDLEKALKEVENYSGISL